MVRRPQALGLAAAVLLALTAQVEAASAQGHLPGKREPGSAGGPVSPLEQAREESAVQRRPRSRFDLPGGKLHVTSERLAAAGQKIRFAVDLDRPVADATLSFKLPALWLRRAPGGLPFARPASAATQAGGRARLRRSGREARLDLHGARATDTPALEVDDVGIPAGTYEIPYDWRAGNGARIAGGTVRVVLYAPTREAHAPTAFSALRGNVSDNTGSEESETFVATTPGNANRVVVGVNSDLGFAVWVSGNGGQTWVRRAMPNTMDAPGSAVAEGSDMCCDPMLAADTLGNVWYGGLSFENGPLDAGPDGPSRIAVNRIAAGTDTLRPVSTGLPVRAADTQDKPLMTIDNTPSSPTFGRLYVVWDEPGTGGGVNLVISQCDTRPGGVPNAANCDNADNWSAPADVTPGEGSYIFGDVAVGPDGRVYVSWWDFSSTNAIRADACDPRSQNCASGAGWGGPSTVAGLDATGGAPVPFACPIMAQPGGRASPAPGIEVSHAGPTSGRVYVSWGDLRAGSGPTRCSELPTGDGTPPLPTHLTWDSFVASAPGGALPGGPSPSTSVGTRLLTDGEGGGQPNSDDWFPWLSVDQTNGQAVADFYSTRDDSSRQTTQFYLRGVTPSGGGHALGPLTRVSTAPSDYSGPVCCDFANDYGDYEGLDATQSLAFPVWTDNSAAAGGDGEAFTAAVPFVASGGGGPGSATGQTPAPASRDSRRPRLRLAFPSGASRVLRRRALTFLFRPDETVRATYSVRVSLPGAARLVRLRRVTRTVAAHRRVRVRLRLSGALLRATSRTLRRGRPVVARVSIRAADGAGNVGTVVRRIRFRR